jgi:CHAT domain-containing protein
VVLSGCRAGSGSSVPGEGIAGLGRAWLLAGVHSVAATLWPVDDDSGEFLQAFYRLLQDAPEEAVRQAQLEMIESGTWRARPRYWAAYFVMGRA